MKKNKPSLLTILILVEVILICSVVGFIVGKQFGTKYEIDGHIEYSLNIKDCMLSGDKMCTISIFFIGSEGIKCARCGAWLYTERKYVPDLKLENVDIHGDESQGTEMYADTFIYKNHNAGIFIEGYMNPKELITIIPNYDSPIR